MHICRLVLVTILGAGVALGAIAAPAPATAQDLPMTLTSSINAGVMWHRLEGTGTNPFFAFRTDYVVSDLSVAEFSLGYGQPAQDFGRSHFLLAEGQYQIRWPFNRFAPYLGMGAGVVADTPVDDVDAVGTAWSPTFAAGAGVRTWLDATTRVRADVRWRGIGADFAQTSLEVTFGLGWRW